MEASAIQARTAIGRTRGAIGTPLLRLRSDQQLVTLFRAGHDEAFRVIHDRYRQRLLAYTRQMLPGSHLDAEDALQDVFVRAYRGLRANDRDLSLRPWLYRVARNRCVDELRRPAPPPAIEMLDVTKGPEPDPVAETERRETMRRLVTDVGRLPEQQRSALLLRELGGMSYANVAGVLDVSIPAVKSLLVRARLGLAQSLEARDTACSEIRHELAVAHDRGVRPSGRARRHLRDCAGCRHYRSELRSLSRQLGALVPAVGPLGVLAKLLGVGGGAGGGAGATATGSATAAGGATASGALVSSGLLSAGAGHAAALLAAAVLTAGGAVELQRTSAAHPATTLAHHVAPAVIGSHYLPAVRPSRPASPAPTLPASRPARPPAHHAARVSPVSPSGSTGAPATSPAAPPADAISTSAASLDSTTGTVTPGGSAPNSSACAGGTVPMPDASSTCASSATTQLPTTPAGPAAAGSPAGPTTPLPTSGSGTGTPGASLSSWPGSSPSGT